MCYKLHPNWQAADLQPDASLLQRHAAFLTLLVGHRADAAGGGPDSTSIVKKVIGYLIDIALKGHALIAANRRCVSVASGDIMQHLR